MDRNVTAGKGRWVVGTTLILLLICPVVNGALMAQPVEPDGYEPHPIPDTPRWATEFSLLGANAAVGGVTAGVARKLRGGSFRAGFIDGAFGGAAIYAGKRIAVERFDGAGLIGRSVAATGSSMVRNASEGTGPFSELILPFGPVRLYIDGEDGLAVRPKIDVNSLVLIVYALNKPNLELDVGSSFSAGTPVFRAPRHVLGSPADTTRAAGKVVESVVFLSDLPWRDRREAAEIFAHERVHVLQKDQLFATISDPLMGAIFRRVPGGATVYRYIDLHPTDLLFQMMRLPFPDYESRPWEVEAFHLMRR